MFQTNKHTTIWTTELTFVISQTTKLILLLLAVTSLIATLTPTPARADGSIWFNGTPSNGSSRLVNSHQGCAKRLRFSFNSWRVTHRARSILTQEVNKYGDSHAY